MRQALATDELSIGDYVLTNGTLPAAVVVDAVVRLLPGVLGGGEAATRDESFTDALLEHPQYTRPPEYRGMRVPAVLQGGATCQRHSYPLHPFHPIDLRPMPCVPALIFPDLR